jgi:choline dehydrogenase-like flavoprotein
MSYEADYVVVGAGAAGSVVAARLAEDGTRSVILVEAGPDNTADPTIAVAARFPFLLDLPAPIGPNPSPSHWGFTSKQNGKTYCYPRGTGLGGSTNHHATVDGRGTPLIYDDWARETGDERWTYERLLPFFRKMENFDVPYVDETVHGKTGWLHIKRGKLEKRFHPDLLHVLMQEHGMPFRHDFYNDRHNYSGVGWCDMQVHHDGRRSNAAIDLLLPTLKQTELNGWNNLRILTDTLTTRVLFDDTRAIGIEALDGARAYKADAAYRSESRAAKTIIIKARKEVILCGGAINSPQLLMLSGIGPRDHLAQHGISVVRDLPGVGQHVQDHLEVCHVFDMKNLPDKVWRWQSTLLAEAGAHYATKADPSSFTENYIPLVFDWFSGFDAPNPMHPDLHIHVFTAFFRDFNLNPQRWVDPDPLKATYLDQFLSQVDATAPKAFNTFFIECVKPSPTRGQITLWSTDPTEPPVVDLGLYEADADVTRVAMGIQLTRRVMAHPILRQYDGEEVLPGPSYESLEQLKDYLRKYSSFGHHISGTAKMGRTTDPMSVVDSECRVLGIQGLRVCDASIFPELPSYNTSRPSYLVGEVLGHLLTTEHDRMSGRANRATATVS